MYSTTWCGYCKRLKSQLADLGVSFEEINIEEVPGTADIVEKVNGGNQTVPTLVFSDGSSLTNPSAKQVVDKVAQLQGQLIGMVAADLGAIGKNFQMLAGDTKFVEGVIAKVGPIGQGDENADIDLRRADIGKDSLRMVR